jgi:hypothetical protein
MSVACREEGGRKKEEERRGWVGEGSREQAREGDTI